ncbi:response regulator transcription factor [Pantanalinema rosaneae CENA516]|uniref:response regulator transcription factor n=1 Tax=Pantanalinema rosaneae TaxID=1620701 RepID=UPI003D6F9EFF
MLDEANAPIPFSNSSKEWLQPYVIKEFLIENTRCAIVSLGKVLEDLNHPDLLFSLESFPLPILGQFEIDRQLYAVVRTQNNALKKDTEITQLLTGRELQVTQYVALGWSNKQIGHQLRISEWTVSTHLRRIFMKLGVDSRAAAVYRCASFIHEIDSELFKN